MSTSASSENVSANAVDIGDVVDPWVGKIIWKGDNPLQDSSPGKIHGQESLVGNSPCCRRVRHD